MSATDPATPPGPRLGGLVVDLDPAVGDLARARATVAAIAERHGAAGARAATLALIDAHPDALARTCAPGHLTGSALVLDAEGKRCLLLRHRKLRRWLQPGGHADGEGELAAVALREAREETGIAGLGVHPTPIDLDVHEVRPPGEPAHLHHDVRFLVVAPPGAEAAINHESTGARWVDVAVLVQGGPATAACLDGERPDDSIVRLVRAGVERFEALRDR